MKNTGNFLIVIKENLQRFALLFIIPSILSGGCATSGFEDSFQDKQKRLNEIAQITDQDKLLRIVNNYDQYLTDERCAALNRIEDRNIIIEKAGIPSSAFLDATIRPCAIKMLKNDQSILASIAFNKSVDIYARHDVLGQIDNNDILGANTDGLVDLIDKSLGTITHFETPHYIAVKTADKIQDKGVKSAQQKKILNKILQPSKYAGNFPDTGTLRWFINSIEETQLLEHIVNSDYSPAMENATSFDKSSLKKNRETFEFAKGLAKITIQKKTGLPEEELKRIVLAESENINLRIDTVKKIKDAKFLYNFLVGKRPEDNLAKAVAQALANSEYADDVVLNKNISHDYRIAIIDKLGDQQLLAKVALDKSDNPAVRKSAIYNLEDSEILHGLSLDHEGIVNTSLLTGDSIFTNDEIRTMLNLIMLDKSIRDYYGRLSAIVTSSNADTLIKDLAGTSAKGVVELKRKNVSIHNHKSMETIYEFWFEPNSLTMKPVGSEFKVYSTSGMTWGETKVVSTDVDFLEICKKLIAPLGKDAIKEITENEHNSYLKAAAKEMYR